MDPMGWILSGLALLAVVAIIIALIWSFDPFGRRKRAEARADQAEKSETLTKGASAALEKAQANETKVQGKANEAVDDVKSQPGADQPLSPGLRDAFKRGVDGVRNPERPTGPGGGNPPKTVPTR
jgi:hypothetical protein